MTLQTSRLREYAANPGAFRTDLIVDVNGQPRRFGDVIESWQAADFAALDQALMRCNGRHFDATGPARAYLERPEVTVKRPTLPFWRHGC